MHRRQDGVAARLQRQVEVFAHGGGLGHGGDRVVAKVLRMRARVPNPADSLDRTDLGQQVCEERTGPPIGIPGGTGDRRPVELAGLVAELEREVAAVGVHVLAEEGHLGHAVGRELPNLVDDRTERLADLVAAHRRHDAERTRVVAPDLDRHPREVAHLATRRERTREQVTVVEDGCLEDLGDRALSPRLFEQVDGAVHIVRPEDDVDVAGLLLDEVTVLLGEAAADHDLQLGPGGLDGLEVPEGAVELVVRVLPNAAGVEHHDVGVVDAVGRHHTVGFEQPRDSLGVVLVHLTPVGADQVPLGHRDSVRDGWSPSVFPA